jgi:hypothetical protein
MLPGLTQPCTRCWPPPLPRSPPAAGLLLPVSAPAPLPAPCVRLKEASAAWLASPPTPAAMPASLPRRPLPQARPSPLVSVRLLRPRQRVWRWWSGSATCCNVFDLVPAICITSWDQCMSKLSVSMSFQHNAVKRCCCPKIVHAKTFRKSACLYFWHMNDKPNN